MDVGTYSWWLTNPLAASLLIGTPLAAVSIGLLLAISRTAFQPNAKSRRNPGTLLGRALAAIQAAPPPWWERPIPGTAIRVIELIFGFAGLIATAFAVVAIYQAQFQTALAQQALTDQRISSAWQILSITGGGTTGKAYAIGQLLSARQDVNGLLLGCDTSGTEPRPSKLLMYDTALPCLRPAFISGTDWIGQDWSETEDGGPRVKLTNSDFTGSVLSNVIIKNVAIDSVNFDYAAFSQVKFVSSSLIAISFDDVLTFPDFFSSYLHQVSFSRGNLSGVTFQNVEFSSVSFSHSDLSETHFASSVFEHINISGARICDSHGEGLNPKSMTGKITCNSSLDKNFFDNSYYEEQNPPVELGFLQEEMGFSPVCDQGMCRGRLVRRPLPD